MEKAVVVNIDGPEPFGGESSPAKKQRIGAGMSSEDFFSETKSTNGPMILRNSAETPPNLRKLADGETPSENGPIAVQSSSEVPPNSARIGWS